MEVFDRIADKNLLVRKVNITANNLIKERELEEKSYPQQIDMFTDLEELEEEKKKLKREKSIQKAMLGIKMKFGKNAVIKGMNLKEGATTINRNKQIGGHHE